MIESNGTDPIHWYYNFNLKPRGPLSIDELKNKIRRGEVSLNTLVQKETERDWNPARSYTEFSPDLFPALQNVTWPVDFISKQWILLGRKEEGGQFEQRGPLSIYEILELISHGLIAKNCYVWKQGLSGWALIMERPEFTPTSEARGISQDLLNKITLKNVGD